MKCGFESHTGALKEKPMSKLDAKRPAVYEALGVKERVEILSQVSIPCRLVKLSDNSVALVREERLRNID